MAPKRHNYPNPLKQYGFHLGNRRGPLRRTISVLVLLYFMNFVDVGHSASANTNISNLVDFLNMRWTGDGQELVFVSDIKRARRLGRTPKDQARALCNVVTMSASGFVFRSYPVELHGVQNVEKEFNDLITPFSSLLSNGSGCISDLGTNGFYIANFGEALGEDGIRIGYATIANLLTRADGIDQRGLGDLLMLRELCSLWTFLEPGTVSLIDSRLRGRLPNGEYVGYHVATDENARITSLTVSDTQITNTLSFIYQKRNTLPDWMPSEVSITVVDAGGLHRQTNRIYAMRQLSRDIVSEKWEWISKQTNRPGIATFRRTSQGLMMTMNGTNSVVPDNVMSNLFIKGGGVWPEVKQTRRMIVLLIWGFAAAVFLAFVIRQKSK